MGTDYPLRAERSGSDTMENTDLEYRINRIWTKLQEKRYNYRKLERDTNGFKDLKSQAFCSGMAVGLEIALTAMDSEGIVSVRNK